MTSIEQLHREITDLKSMVHTLLVQQGEWLSTEQVCQRLGCSRSTLHRYALAQGFPARGKSGKYLLSEVIEWERQKLGS